MPLYRVKVAYTTSLPSSLVKEADFMLEAKNPTQAHRLASESYPDAAFFEVYDKEKKRWTYRSLR